MINSIITYSHQTYQNWELEKVIASSQAKIQALCAPIFKSLSKFFSSCIAKISAWVWPYDRVYQQNQYSSTDSALEKVLANLEAIQAERRRLTSVKPLLEQDASAVISPVTTACFGAASLLSSAIAVQNYGHQPVFTHLCAAGSIYELLSYPISASATPETLATWGAPPLDFIDSGIVTAVAAVAATSLELCTFGCAPTPTRFMATLIITTPPIQNALRKTPSIKWVSDKTHEMHDRLRESVVDLIAPPVARAIAPYLVRAGQKAVKSFRAEMSSPELAIHSTSDYTVSDGRTWFDWLQSGFQEAAETECAIQAAKLSDTTARVIVGIAFDLTVEQVAYRVQLACINQGAYDDYTPHRALTSFTFLLAGGPEQTVREVFLRTIGAVYLYSTDSVFGASLIVYTPKIIEYALTLSGRYRKKAHIAHQPAGKTSVERLSLIGHTVAELLSELNCVYSEPALLEPPQHLPASSPRLPAKTSHGILRHFKELPFDGVDLTEQEEPMDNPDGYIDCFDLGQNGTGYSAKSTHQAKQAPESVQPPASGLNAWDYSDLMVVGLPPDSEPPDEVTTPTTPTDQDPINWSEWWDMDSNLPTTTRIEEMEENDPPKNIPSDLGEPEPLDWMNL